MMFLSMIKHVWLSRFLPAARLLVCQLSGPPDSADSHLPCLGSRAHLTPVSSSPQPYDCTTALAFRLRQLGSLHMELFSFLSGQMF